MEDLYFYDLGLDVSVLFDEFSELNVEPEKEECEAPNKPNNLTEWAREITASQALKELLAKITEAERTVEDFIKEYDEFIKRASCEDNDIYSTRPKNIIFESYGAKYRDKNLHRPYTKRIRQKEKL